MANMDELAFAMKMRDVVASLVADELQKQRPKYRYAKVSSITLGTRKVNVIFNGETSAVTVNMGHFLFVKVNDIVRVDGVGVDKFISDIIGWDGLWAAAELGTASATALKTIKRDAVGNAQVTSPLTGADIANRTYVDGAVSAALVTVGDSMPIGAMLASTLATPPSTWLNANGTAVSRTTYASLFAALNPTVGTFTVTIATPGVFTLTGHGMQTGQQVYLTTTGALPTGLAQNTNYWVIRVSANTFNLATSLVDAIALTAIATTGIQSGTHTLRTTYGVGDGSTTFNLPNPGLQPPIVATGTETITPSAANTPTSLAVTFPTGLFSAVPRVTVTANTSAPGTVITGVSANSPSITGFTAYLTRTNTTASVIFWIAVQDIPPSTTRYIIKAQAGGVGIYGADTTKVGKINRIYLTSSGTYNKPANLLAAEVECHGAGAGSGGNSATGAGQTSGGNGGGAGGSTIKLYLASDLSASESYVVGAGGAGTPSGSPTATSTSGGNTTFKGMTASGGAGSGQRGPSSGNFSSNGGGNGGAATGGDVNIVGGDGFGAWSAGATVTTAAGKGGESLMGHAAEPMIGHSGITWAALFNPGRGYGAGGSGNVAGASQSAHSGQDGLPGLIIITEYLSS